MRVNTPTKRLGDGQAIMVVGVLLAVLGFSRVEAEMPSDQAVKRPQLRGLAKLDLSQKEPQRSEAVSSLRRVTERELQNFPCGITQARLDELELDPATSFTNDPCHVCPAGTAVGSPESIVTLPQGQYTCCEFSWAAAQGVIPAQQCGIVMMIGPGMCGGCLPIEEPVDITPSPTTPSPTTPSPTTPSPTTPSPTTPSPTTPSPTTPSPTTPSPTTPSPTTPSPTTPSPTTPSPTTPSPTTPSPTTPAPVTPSPTTTAPVAANDITGSPTTTYPCGLTQARLDLLGVDPTTFEHPSCPACPVGTQYGSPDNLLSIPGFLVDVSCCELAWAAMEGAVSPLHCGFLAGLGPQCGGCQGPQEPAEVPVFPVDSDALCGIDQERLVDMGLSPEMFENPPCQVCPDGQQLQYPDSTIVLPGYPAFSCCEFSWAATAGLLPANQCSAVGGHGAGLCGGCVTVGAVITPFSTTCELTQERLDEFGLDAEDFGNPPCPVCPEGQQIGSPENTLELDGYPGGFSCCEFSLAAMEGVVPPERCSAVQTTGPGVCGGCHPIEDPVEVTPSPTTPSPTTPSPTTPSPTTPSPTTPSPTTPSPTTPSPTTPSPTTPSPTTPSPTTPSPTTPSPTTPSPTTPSPTTPSPTTPSPTTPSPTTPAPISPSDVYPCGITQARLGELGVDPATSFVNPPCPVCPPGTQVGMPENIVALPQGQYTCCEFSWAAAQGVVPEPQCGMVMMMGPGLCGGCIPIEEPVDNTPAPTTPAPTTPSPTTPSPTTPSPTTPSPTTPSPTTPSPTTPSPTTPSPTTPSPTTPSPTTPAPTTPSPTTPSPTTPAPTTPAPTTPAPTTPAPTTPAPTTPAPTTPAPTTPAPISSSDVYPCGLTQARLDELGVDPATSFTNDPCPVCPTGTAVALPEQILTLPQGTYTCCEFSWAAGEGVIPASQCGLVMAMIPGMCGGCI